MNSRTVLEMCFFRPTRRCGRWARRRRQGIEAGESEVPSDEVYYHQKNELCDIDEPCFQPHLFFGDSLTRGRCGLLHTETVLDPLPAGAVGQTWVPASQAVGP